MPTNICIRSKQYMLTNITSLSLPDIYRAQHVKRWHIIHTSRQQTVAEHSHMVAMISLHIVAAIGEEHFDDKDKLDILQWSLIHDLPEVIIGDAVSPVKRMAKEKFDELEKQVDPKLKKYEISISGDIKAVVKIADYIDALKYLKKEGLNGQAVSIYNRLYKDMKQYIETVKGIWSGCAWDAVYGVLVRLIEDPETYIDDII